jgi:DNA-binding transcriptional MerR regulator
LTHITQDQKDAINALREKNVSLRQIAKQLDLKLGTVKTIHYSGRPPAAKVVKARNGQFKSSVRTGPGRRPANGLEAASDKQRAAACRERRRERMVQLAGNLSAATDTELATLLQSAIRTGDNTVKAIVFELHGRYCGNL